MHKRSSKERESQDASNVAPDVLQGPNEEVATQRPPIKNPAAVELGRLGGLRGGKARALKLEPEKRKEIARLAAVARWSKVKTSKETRHE